MLNIQGINTYYGKLHVLKDISMTINTGEITTLLGANGAGKTTLLKTISGILHPQSGELLLENQSIKSMSPQKITGLGVAHVPEGRHVFGDMTVQENLEMGAFIRKDKGAVAQDLEEVFTIFPKLKARRKQLAGSLSGGEQQMVAMGRALMLRPKLLLLDEPSMGLAPIIVEEIFKTIINVNKTRGTTVLLIEQNAQAALEISDKAYVIEVGSITLTGSGQELLHDSRVREAYLGL